MRASVIPLAVLGLFASSPGDEPTELQMRNAFEAALAAQVRNALDFASEVGTAETLQRIFAARSDQFTITSFRKGDCARLAGKAGHLCAFTVSIELSNGNLERRINGRFSAGAHGFAFAEDA